MAVKSIGKMRDRVEFLNNTGKSVLGAGFRDGYTTVYTCWGMLRMNGGNKDLGFGREFIINQYFLTVRHSEALATALKVSTKVKVDGVQYSLMKYDLIENLKRFYFITLNGEDSKV